MVPKKVYSYELFRENIERVHKKTSLNGGLNYFNTQKLVLKAKHFIYIRLVDASMEPTFLQNQQIKLVLYPFAEIVVGDIIVFSERCMDFIVCRVVEIDDSKERREMKVKGDNPKYDKIYLINKDMYLGKTEL